MTLPDFFDFGKMDAYTYNENICKYPNDEANGSAT
jgi:hypothetical protein